VNPAAPHIGRATDYGRDVEDLPYVDVHEVLIAVPPARVWAALESSLARVLGGDGSLLTRVLGCSPPSGFAVASRVEGERLELAGRHRFSRYRLVFGLAEDASGSTRLSAATYAAFPGPHGAAYRLMVVGSRAHVLATRRMLASVAARATGSR
jgi:hypothetical protein